MPRRKEKKYHFIYKITNKMNDKFYIGIHSTYNLDDGYLGSGKIIRYSIKKYGKENHSMEILEFFKDREHLLDGESKIVNEDLLKDPLCINLQLGGNNGWGIINGNSEIQKEKSKKGNEKIKWLLKNDEKWVTEYKLKISLAVKESLKNKNTWSGRKHSETTLTKMKESHKGKHSHNRDKRWISNGIEVKRISSYELPRYLEMGWNIGRKII